MAESDRSTPTIDAPENGKTIVIIDDDDMFRDTLQMNLEDEGFAVRTFSDGRTALDYFSESGIADVVLLDWRMPQMDGLEVLRRMRDAGVEIPVIFLTSLSDQIYEEAALDRGAVDFVEKSRSFSIVLRRIQLIAEGTKSAADGATTGGKEATPIILAALELRPDISRAFWNGNQINLTMNEFRVVLLLAGKAGNDVSYRQIYDVVHGEGFIAGYGEKGHRANVRSLIKRIRQKFKDTDDNFKHIENYPGFGYRWTDDQSVAR